MELMMQGTFRLTLRINVALFAIFSVAVSQQAISIPDSGWHLWLDKDARWENDTIYLPQDVVLSRLPVNAPSGGWEQLSGRNGIGVVLPTTVEEHFWGTNGLRRYHDEYFYESEDTTVQNGNYLGVSWWWRSVDLPRTFKGKKVVLFIRGARLRAEVYWNRQLVGYHIINETSFECDVSNAIKPGEKNLLAIRITNPGGRLDWLDTQLMPWGKTTQLFHRSHGFGGLDRGIILTSHPPLYVSNSWVLNTADLHTIQAHALLSNTARESASAQVRFEILDPAGGNSVLATMQRNVRLKGLEESHVEVMLCGRNTTAWNLGTPKLYVLRTELITGRKGKQIRDTRDVRFGFRWFTAEGIGTNAILRFNGERIRLVSAISWGFWGLNGLWPTPELAKREVMAAKTLGLNCMQFHRNVGKVEVLDAQDRLGLYRYMEPGGGQTSFGEKFSLYAGSSKDSVDPSGKSGDPATFAEKFMEEKIIRMVRDYRSHPSLLLYCIQNEIHPDLHNPRIFRILRRVHQEDPSRIVVLKSGFPSGSPSINQAWMEPYSDLIHYDSGNGISGWWDDHTVGGPGVWRDEMYKSPQDFTHRSTNDREISMWGEMLGAASPDNHVSMVKEILSHGGRSYDLNDHREILEAYERFLDRWGFRSAFPTADALFTSVGNKSYDFWGRVIETARLAEANDYFVISGWESTAIENHSGLVDNFRNFKGDPTLIGTRLALLRPVIRTRSLVYATGEEASVDLFLLNEMHAPHTKSLRAWIESPGGGTKELGIFPVPQFETDKFVYSVAAGVGTGTFERPGVYVIHARLEGSEGTSSADSLLVVDPIGSGALPRTIGILSSIPSLRRSFEILPGVTAEMYQPEKTYDLVIAANRFVRPPETGTDPTVEIANTDDDELYRTIAYGDPNTLEFMFPGLRGDSARVTLKFAELFQNAEGMRVFDVALNGKVVMKDFDVFKAAGGKNTAVDTAFFAAIPEGVLRITFPTVPKPSARICAAKIETHDTTIAINCGGRQYVDKRGLVWQPYQPSPQLDASLLRKVMDGMPLLVLSEGDAATEKYGEELGRAGAIDFRGNVGEARASWMGSWYFVRQHPVYEGLPVKCALGSYYQAPVTNAGGVLIEGKDVEVIAGYGRDHDRSIGAASFATKLGKGTILFHSLPGVVSGLYGQSEGMHPLVLKRLIANAIRYLTKK